MTTVSDGLNQWGGSPVASAHRFAGMWSGKVWFVDGRDGLDGNTGKTPQKAFLTLARAVAMAGKDDTIYVRPLNAGVRYTENVVIPTTSNSDHTYEGLSIIGTGNGGVTSRDQSCVLRGVTGVNSPVFTANASYGNFENLTFLSVPAQKGTAGGVGGCFGILARQNSAAGGTIPAQTTGFNIGTSIVNCGFIGDMYNEATTTECVAGIYYIATDNQLVENCQFMDVRVGILSSGDLTGNSCILVKSNLFKGVAANIAADMYMIDVAGLDIVDNKFLHAVPSHAGPATLTKYVIIGGTVTGGMSGNYQSASAVAAGTNNSISGLICGGNFGLGGPWTT